MRRLREGARERERESRARRGEIEKTEGGSERESRARRGEIEKTEGRNEREGERESRA